MDALSRARRRLAVSTLAVVIAAAVTGCGDDDAPAEPAVAVTDAWARPTPPGVDVGAAYVTLEANVDDALVGLSIAPDVAAAAELHEVFTDDDGVSEMRQLPAIELPAGEVVTIETGEAHVMLVDLAAPLEVGDTFALTFDFDVAPDVTVEVPVADSPPN